MNPKDMMVIDANAEALGIPKSSLMENAGRCIAKKIIKISKPCKVAIFAGTGGNGGDGFVAARYLLNKGYEVEIFLLGHPSRIKLPESKRNWELLNKLNLEMSSIKLNLVEDSSLIKNTDAKVIVDAMLGTGTKGELREPFSSAIDIINGSDCQVVAVDFPTGLDPLGGIFNDKVVKANLTVTFHSQKTGLEKAGSEYVGTVHVCDIGIPYEAELFTGPGDLLRLRKRDINAHKGENGRLIVVGGSNDYSGAPAFAAMSALRSGVDISTVACPSSVLSPIRSYSPDIIVRGLSNNYINFDDTSKILELSEDVDAMVLGCGIGRKEETRFAINEMVEKITLPIVIDADALKMLNLDLIKNYRNHIVLTPHKAEFKSLFGFDIPEKLNKKIEVIMETSSEYECTVLLKGVVDIISDGDSVKLNSTGNPGMTVGGTGDLLAGLVGGLMAQGHTAFEAAYLGSYINGAAGDLAMNDYSYNFVASDILKYIPRIFKSQSEYSQET
jgi:ADP-dependent NAD(P)H-hydrate dehydratase / NAD(P)H-hydrate epimerase